MNRINNWVLVGLMVLMPFGRLVASDGRTIVIADFNASTFGEWKSTGDAFRHGPARGAELLQKLEITQSPDNALACSEMDGDAPQGRLTSPLFTIERDFIAFRIGGGNYERHTCINLLINDQIVRSATGWNSDRLNASSWNVAAWRGKQARIELVDESSDSWGHINVDEIIQTDHPESRSEPVEEVYRESLRPQFHITARQWTMDRLNPGMRQEGWINDVNGMIYYEGVWHFFAQRWNKCWLHMTSDDLVHWVEHEPAFWEEQCNSGVQSGSCVVDYENTSGLASDPNEPPMLAFWSRNDNHSQCMSYSLDRGKTWQHYAKNPIFTFPERDPKVFWYAPGKHWVMLLYGRDDYHILNSTNLLDWTKTGNVIPQGFECPDMFEIAIEDQPDVKRWVLVYADGKYTVGDFDGKKFLPEHRDRYLTDVGDFYATQSFNNTDRGANNRRIQMAWMRFSDFPDMPFRQQITFPCEVTLRKTSQGLRLYREPIREIESLHADESNWSKVTLRENSFLPLKPQGRHFHIKAGVDIPENGQLIFNIRGEGLLLSRNKMKLGPYETTTRDPIHTIEILVDSTSIEAFLNQGETSCTKFQVFHENGLSLQATGAPVKLENIQVFSINSSWLLDSNDQ